MKIIDIVCQQCGKTFKGDIRRSYCDDCIALRRIEASKRQVIAKRKRELAGTKYDAIPDQIVKMDKYHSYELEEKLREATKLKMSYGLYQAMLMLNKNKEV